MITHAKTRIREFLTIAGTVPVLLSGSFSSEAAHAATTVENVQHLDRLLSYAKVEEDVVQVDDMRVKASTLRAYRDRLASTSLTRAALPYWVRTWTGGVVPYAYASSVSTSRRAEFEAAIREWQLAANLKFVPRTTQADYILVVAANDGNWSWIGRNGGVQELHIQQWADTGMGSRAKYLICHEIGHALGFIHEQSREDRNDYVTVLFGNVDTAAYGTNVVRNFDIMPGSLNQGTYDFDSIMHYRANTFARPGTITIQAKAPYSSYQGMMGQMTHLSTLDKSGMAAIYGLSRSISGAVRTETGVALSGASLRITGSSPYRAQNPMPNLSNGSYSFRGLPGDTYKVKATKAGYALIPSVHTVKITTRNAGAMDFIALQGTRISGRVTKGTVGLAGVAVTRRNLLTGARVSVTTNSKGYYGFSNVPTGPGITYTLLLSKPGYVFSTTSLLPLNESVPTNYDKVNFKALLSTSTVSGPSS